MSSKAPVKKQVKATQEKKENEKAEKMCATDYLRKYWIWFLVAILVIIGLVWFFYNKKRKASSAALEETGSGSSVADSNVGEKLNLTKSRA
jgi:flagellar biosynthesis/type III secretory pathway M-ring protein FliF/YscJ